jgi:PKD repeat protein
MKKKILFLLMIFVLSFQENAQTSLNPSLVAGCKGSWSFDDTGSLWVDGSSTRPLVPKGTAPTTIAGPLAGDNAPLRCAGLVVWDKALSASEIASLESFLTPIKSPPTVDFSVPSPTVRTGSSIVFTDLSSQTPTQWAWSFPGGTPATSTLQKPTVTYNTAGTYDVTLTATNLMGSGTLTKTGYIAVQDNLNLALNLDGNDNNCRIGMDIIKSNWTLEAWIKGDASAWRATEAIIGCGGEYGDINTITQLPLAVVGGKLSCSGGNLLSPNVLDNNWHHVASSCDGTTTKLYLDGVMVASITAKYDILPGAIGVKIQDATTFGGMIDEVRIWTTAIPIATLNTWKGKPINKTHPDYANLKGYYTFEDMTDETAINLVGKGHLPFHMRNGRTLQYGTLPLAYPVINNNPAFVAPVDQEICSATTIQSEWDADKGALNNQALKLRVAINGNANPFKITELTLDFANTTNLSDISKVHVYYTGQTARSTTKVELFGTGTTPAALITLTEPLASAQTLKSGVNYFLVTFDVSSTATLGNTLMATVPSFKLNGSSYIPEENTANVRKTVTTNSTNDPNVLKVLQTNIWHGGVHVGLDGIARIKDMIMATNADVITMQEGYGAQQRIATELGYNLQTENSGDNLALFSRFPMTKITSAKTFNSNLAKITMPNGRKVLINDWWLRYASEENDYTDYYPNTGMTPNKWVSADNTLSKADATANITNDVTPALAADPTLAVIIGGDFNSGSHLDWTAAAASLHYGYSAALPTSQYMITTLGYKDSFRELYPNEVTYPQGTWAPIYGHLQTCRIDYIYYKGANIQATSTKIVRTPAEIDFVWASDHASVLTTFNIPNSAMR